MSENTDTEIDKIQELLKDVHLFKDPELIERVKKNIRKKVPLLMRGYVLAYLYINSKYYTEPIDNGASSKIKEGKNIGKNANNAKTDKTPDKTLTKKTESAKKPFSKPALEGTASIYVGIGKLSKISPKGIVQFICTNTGIKESDILSLSYKQNYSFITVKEELGKLIVSKTNGQTFKGKRIRVNFANSANIKE